MRRSQKIKCAYCPLELSRNNMSRHVGRIHTEHCSTDGSSVVSSRASSPDARSVSSHGSRVPIDYIKNAVLCMMRRPEGNTIPSMVRYLTANFARIPESLRVPLIVATFTAAQKAAATHGDTLLSGDDQQERKRIMWSKRSLARWGHGLSGVEPSAHEVNDDIHQPHSEDLSMPSLIHYDVTENLLNSRQLPVPADSTFAQADIVAAFQGSTFDDMTDITTQSSTVYQLFLTTVPSVSQSDGSVAELVNDDPLPTDVGNDDQQKSGADSGAQTSAIPSSPTTFQDLLSVDTDDPILLRQLTRPLAASSSPTSSSLPQTVDSETPLQLYTSPVPSLEVEPDTSKDVEEERLSDLIPKADEVKTHAKMVRKRKAIVAQERDSSRENGRENPESSKSKVFKNPVTDKENEDPDHQMSKKDRHGSDQTVRVLTPSSNIPQSDPSACPPSGKEASSYPDVREHKDEKKDHSSIQSEVTRTVGDRTNKERSTPHSRKHYVARVNQEQPRYREHDDFDERRRHHDHHGRSHNNRPIDVGYNARGWGSGWVPDRRFLPPPPRFAPYPRDAHQHFTGGWVKRGWY